MPGHSCADKCPLATLPADALTWARARSAGASVRIAFHARNVANSIASSTGLLSGDWLSIQVAKTNCFVGSAPRNDDQRIADEVTPNVLSDPNQESLFYKKLRTDRMLRFSLRTNLPGHRME